MDNKKKSRTIANAALLGAMLFNGGLLIHSVDKSQTVNTEDLVTVTENAPTTYTEWKSLENKNSDTVWKEIPTDDGKAFNCLEVSATPQSVEYGNGVKIYSDGADLIYEMPTNEEERSRAEIHLGVSGASIEQQYLLHEARVVLLDKEDKPYIDYGDNRYVEIGENGTVTISTETQPGFIEPEKVYSILVYLPAKLVMSNPTEVIDGVETEKEPVPYKIAVRL